MRVMLQLGILIFGSACLTVDDLEPRDPLTGQTNSPPRFEDGSISPESWRPIVLGHDEITGCSIRLSVGVVVDEDLTDELYAKWFVNYDRNNPTMWHVHPIAATEQPNRLGTSWEFKGSNFERGVYVVTVVVSDGFADVAEDPAKVREGRASASHSWVIDTTSGECHSPKGGTR